MRSVIVALALSSATALIAPSAPRMASNLQAATKDPATTSYQPTEGANAAVDTNNCPTPGSARCSGRGGTASRRRAVDGRENVLTPANFMQPIFIHEDSDQVVPIPSMPGQSRHTLDSMVEQVKKGMALGVKSFILFPKVPDDLKTNFADECYNAGRDCPRLVAMCKAACPEATICTDIALDPYSTQGHDGIVLDGKIVNDMTIEQLCKQAVCHARAGRLCGALGHDGRASRRFEISPGCGGPHGRRHHLLQAKYASAFYGPFRDASSTATRGLATKKPTSRTRRTARGQPSSKLPWMLRRCRHAMCRRRACLSRQSSPKRIRDVVDRRSRPTTCRASTR